MPRALGQIDTRKNDAILDAAADAFADLGWSAPIEEIARRAGVSKQTIYNNFGSKVDIARALADRRARTVTAALEGVAAAENPRKALADYGRILLEKLTDLPQCRVMRATIAAAAEAPELAQAVYEHGPRAARLRLAAFLRAETAAGRLNVPEPEAAAEMYAGMVVGHAQLRLLLGLPALMSAGEAAARAERAADAFCKAYAA